MIGSSYLMTDISNNGNISSGFSVSKPHCFKKKQAPRKEIKTDQPTESQGTTDFSCTKVHKMPSNYLRITSLFHFEHKQQQRIEHQLPTSSGNGAALDRKPYLNTNCTFKWHLVFWVTIGSYANLHLTLISLISVVDLGNPIQLSEHFSCYVIFLLTNDCVGSSTIGVSATFSFLLFVKCAELFVLTIFIPFHQPVT